MYSLSRLFSLVALLCITAKTAAQCPVFLACPTQLDTFCDLTPNDPLFWNQPGFVTPLTGISDLFEGPTDLTVQVKTTCGNAADINIRCLLYLDLDADGVQETVVDSDNPPPAGLVMKGNAADPNFAGGSPIVFDARTVPDNQKYRFFFKKTPSGDTLTARLSWNTELQPTQLLTPYLPAGQHRAVWLLQKPGGGTDTCSRTFRVLDCKAPTVTCIPGLSVNIMPTGMIQLWASDFLGYTEDNTTPPNQLQIAVRKEGTGTGFPMNALGEPQTNVVFTCEEVGTRTVQMWSRDKSGNASFCETYVILQDNNANCGSPISLQICPEHHCNNERLEDFEVTVTGSGPGIPFTKVFQSGSDGCATIKGGVPLGSDFTLTPLHDNNPLNGVSTYDLVVISKHILGLAPLPSPYHMIAADANRSGSITTFDIVEIRKLILGIYAELPNNTSWRFVVKQFAFPDPQNPFKTAFPENITVGPPNTWLLGHNFLAMKIGDVNCSASANSFSGEISDRAALPLLAPDRWLAAGETFDLPLWADAPGDWQGCQLGLGYDPQMIDVENVDSEWLPSFDAQHWAKPQPGRVNVSWSGTSSAAVQAGEPLLTVRLRALAPLRLSDALRLNSERLRAELYDSEASPLPLRLEFREQAPSPLKSAVISPPQPNPTTGGAMLRVKLEEDALVAVVVSDPSGREVFRQETAGTAGAMWVEIPASALSQAGLYLWRVSAGGSVRTGKLLRW